MNRDHWLGIELRHLAALAAVAEERSFRGAAKRLGYVQSAVSQQIAFLERVTGTRVVERSRDRGTVTVTPAGELLLHHADRLLAGTAAMRADLERLAAGAACPVRLGILQGVGARIMPSIMKGCVVPWPQLELMPIELPTDEAVLELVRDGELDLGLAYLPPVAGPFASLELTRSPTVLLVGADSPLGRAKRTPTLEEIAHLPLIARRTCRLFARLEGQLEAACGRLDIVFRTDAGQTAQALVGAGIGVALMPRLMVDRTDERIAIIDLDERLPSIGLGLVWHRDRELGWAAEHLGDIAHRACSALVAADAARDEIAVS